jgi:DNA-binding transcriptional MerR regulator
VRWTAMSEKTYSISQVVEMLKDEFPDLSVSKVRFLESKGIIKPKRRDSGYRVFTNEDISLLKKVLILQRDYYMPLKVIKEKITRGELPKIDVSTETSLKEPVKLDNVLKQFKISYEFLDELEKYGMIEPFHTQEGKMINPDDLEVIDLAVKFSQFGIEPRHLRVIENLVSKEALSFEQILFPIVRQKTEESLKNAREVLEILLKLSTSFHRLLIVKSLKQKFPELF